MRFEGRVSAGIELLETLLSEASPPDRLLTAYFKRRRYAGAKDRRAVADRFYVMLRNRGILQWQAAEGGLEVNARSMMLVHLHCTERLSIEDMAALCSGEGFAPAPLTAAERQSLQRTADEAAQQPPGWAVGNYRAALEEPLRRRFGDDLTAELAGLNKRAPVDVRVNTLKSTRDDAATALAAAGLSVTPTPMAPAGLRLPPESRVTDHALFKDGSLEIQDEGSQLAARLVAPPPAGQVVDLCAGAGGKALALSAMMEDRGQIHAFDIDARRLEELNRRRRRADARNIQSRAIAGVDDRHLAALRGGADRVLVDAPCTGTGTWRRHPELRFSAAVPALDELIGQQDGLLETAADLVKPGGRLIYVTCSVLIEENEDRIDALLARRPDFAIQPYEAIWPNIADQHPPGPGPFLRLTPARHGTDGFFAAILNRGPADTATVSDES